MIEIVLLAENKHNSYNSSALPSMKVCTSDAKQFVQLTTTTVATDIYKHPQASDT